MKKLFAILCCLSVCGIMAGKSKIAYDKTSEGVRVVETERTPHVFRMNGTPTDCSVSLLCLKDIATQEKHYGINIFIFSGTEDDDNRKIEKGSKLLLKLEDGDIITAIATSDASTKVELATQNIFGVLTNNVVSTVVSYAIPKELLDKIMTSKVVKVRVETKLGQFDGNVYRNKFSECISDDYILISSVINNDKTIYDDF